MELDADPWTWSTNVDVLKFGSVSKVYFPFTLKLPILASQNHDKKNSSHATPVAVAKRVTNHPNRDLWKGGDPI
jgi:hypothetical protein